MNAIITEVERQNELKNEDQLACAVYEVASNPLLNLSLLNEEVGLVARAINEGKNANLVEELTQVAAIAVAWLEGLYHKKPKRRDQANYGAGVCPGAEWMFNREEVIRCHELVVPAFRGGTASDRVLAQPARTSYTRVPISC